MLETMVMSTNAQIKDHGRKIRVDRGKVSNLQGLKGQPIPYAPEQRVLIAQEFRPLNEQELKE
jgi:hypothetical protein